MEQLILFVIIAIVSSIFGKSKNKKERKHMPPFNKVEPTVNAEEAPRQRHTKSQSFEDFAREFLGERKREQPKVEQAKKIVEQKANDEVPSYVAPPLIPTETMSRTSNRESSDRLRVVKKDVDVAKSHSDFQLSRSKKSLMQAVVMAEVLGPPKAKRK